MSKKPDKPTEPVEPADPLDALDLNDLKPHPIAAEHYQPMSDQDIKALGEDILAHGLCEAMTILDGQILDGNNRYAACRMAPYQLRKEHFIPFSGEDPLIFVLSKNSHRRHLTAEQKRALIVKLLEQRPDASSRLIASIARVSHHTVEHVRKKLVGEIATGQPAQTPPPASENPTGQPAQLPDPTPGDQPPAARKGADGKVRKPPSKGTGANPKNPKALTLIKEKLELITDAASQKEIFLLVFDKVFQKYGFRRVNKWLLTEKECCIHFVDDDGNPADPPNAYVGDEDTQSEGAPPQQ